MFRFDGFQTTTFLRHLKRATGQTIAEQYTSSRTPKNKQKILIEKPHNRKSRTYKIALARHLPEEEEKVFCGRMAKKLRNTEEHLIAAS